MANPFYNSDYYQRPAAFQPEGSAPHQRSPHPPRHSPRTLPSSPPRVIYPQDSSYDYNRSNQATASFDRPTQSGDGISSYSDARWDNRQPYPRTSPYPPEVSGGNASSFQTGGYPWYRPAPSWEPRPSSEAYPNPYTRSQQTPPSSRPSYSLQNMYDQPSMSGAGEPSTSNAASAPTVGTVDTQPPRPRGLWSLVNAPANNTGNPGYSIKLLMEYAIRGSPRGRLSLQDIYRSIEERYPIYKTEWGANWRNSARHDISMDPRFKNVPRGPDEPGKGGLWLFDENAPPKPRKPRRRKAQAKNTGETGHGSAPSANVSERPHHSASGPISRSRHRREREAAAPYPTTNRVDHDASSQIASGSGIPSNLGYDDPSQQYAESSSYRDP